MQRLGTRSVVVLQSESTRTSQIPRACLGFGFLLFLVFILCKCSSIQNWLVKSHKTYVERLLFHRKLWGKTRPSLHLKGKKILICPYFCSSTITTVQKHRLQWPVNTCGWMCSPSCLQNTFEQQMHFQKWEVICKQQGIKFVRLENISEVNHLIASSME